MKFDDRGDRWYEPGDYVTRTGPDVWRVIATNATATLSPDLITIKCVFAPANYWCKVGDEEENIPSRYEPTDWNPEALREVIARFLWTEFATEGTFDEDRHGDRERYMAIADGVIALCK
jgi:hypothetical protein